MTAQARLAAGVVFAILGSGCSALPVAWGPAAGTAADSRTRDSALEACAAWSATAHSEALVRAGGRPGTPADSHDPLSPATLAATRGHDALLRCMRGRGW